MKPEDITIEVWALAEEALMESPLTMVPTHEWRETQTLIARAIMAAKAKEREYCAVQAESRFTPESVPKTAKGKPYSSGNVAVYAAHEIARTIREGADE